MLEDLTEATRAHTEAPCWFEKAHPNSALKTVAYFSMEYMLSEALPIYSGGLGNVAGDQLKAAHDLGVPVLIGTRSVLASQEVSKRLAAAGKPHRNRHPAGA